MAGGCRHDFPLVIFLDKLHSLSLARPSAAGRAVQDNIYLLLPERGSARFSMNPLTSFFLCSHGHVHPPTSVTSVLFLNSTRKAKSWGGTVVLRQGERCRVGGAASWAPVERVRGF